jgi:hypothetical protein
MKVVANSLEHLLVKLQINPSILALYVVPMPKSACPAGGHRRHRHVWRRHQFMVVAGSLPQPRAHIHPLRRSTLEPRPLSSSTLPLLEAPSVAAACHCSGRPRWNSTVRAALFTPAYHLTLRKPPWSSTLPARFQISYTNELPHVRPLCRTDLSPTIKPSPRFLLASPLAHSPSQSHPRRVPALPELYLTASELISAAVIVLDSFVPIPPKLD